MEQESKKEGKLLATYEQVLVQVARNYTRLIAEARADLHVNKDLESYSRKMRKAGKIIIQLPRLLSRTNLEGKKLPAAEILSLQRYAAETKEVLENKNIALLPLVLIPRGFYKEMNLNNLEEIIEKNYPKR